MKRHLLLVIGVAVAVLCFWLSVRDVEWVRLRDGFRGANYTTLPLMLALLAAFYWLKTQRWTWLLAPVRQFRVKELLPTMLIGFAANNILPAHLGEFVRVFDIRRRYQIPAGTVLSTVVLERIFDIVAILILFSLGLTMTDNLPESYRRSAMILAGCAGIAVAFAAAYLIWTERFIRLTAVILSRAPLVPARIASGIVEMLRTGAAGLAALRNVRAVLLITLNSLLQWSLNGAMMYVALRAFGIPVTPVGSLIVTGVTAVGVILPSTPGYFGIIQMCFRVGMECQSVQPDQALVLGASFYYHLSMYIPVTLLGLILLHRSGLSLQHLKSAAGNDGIPELQGAEPAVDPQGVASAPSLITPGDSDAAADGSRALRAAAELCASCGASRPGLSATAD